MSTWRYWGESLAKINQRTFNALIVFLVWTMLFHSTGCNAFVWGVQASWSPKMPSKTILLTINGAAITTSSFLQLPDISPAITTPSFLQLPNDSPAKQHPVPNNDSTAKQHPVPKNGNSSFKQLSVPHNGPAHFKQTFVPMTTASTGLQAYNDHHSSLNDVSFSSLLCNDCNNDCNNDSSPRNNNCNHKSDTKQAWRVISASCQYDGQQCNIEKIFFSHPNQLRKCDDTKRTQSFAAFRPRWLSNYDSSKCQLLTSVDCWVIFYRSQARCSSHHLQWLFQVHWCIGFGGSTFCSISLKMLPLTQTNWIKRGHVLKQPLFKPQSWL